MMMRFFICRRRAPLCVVESSQTLDTTHRHVRGSCHCFHSSHYSRHYHNLPPTRNKLLRLDNSVQMQHARYMSSDDDVARHKLLKCGRARRKMHLKRSIQREKNINSVTTPKEENIRPSIANDGQEKKSNSPSEILFGIPMGNPLKERYIRSRQKIIYPKTWSGWKEVFRKTKDTYLWTFEGFLLPEKKRDEHGNIIPVNEDDIDDEDIDEKTTMKDKAKDAANKMADNLQKNISTIQQEAPKFIQMGQQATGISSREELREWIGQQLKLGTDCLTEFMKGYRSGRDDEVDKMLHEYFKELDEQKETETATHNNAFEGQTNESNDVTSPKQERRLWGRKERRRAKAMSNKAESSSLGITE